MNDWPLIKNTLYDGQKLINLLNMAAGDQKYIDEFKGGTNAFAYEGSSISMTMSLFF